MNRNIAFDIAKGIVIILMILGHCACVPVTIRHFIFSFHMPFFFLVSGYFYKPKDAVTSLKKDFKHLMLPYFLTCAAILLFYLAVWVFTGNNQLKTYFLATLWGSGSDHLCAIFSDVPNIGAIWFLPALLVCKNIYNLLPRWKILLSSILFLVASLIGRYVIYLPFSILSGLSAVIFYAIGDRLKYTEKLRWQYWLIGIICWVTSIAYSKVNVVTTQYDMYFIDVIGAATGSALVVVVAYLISRSSLLVTILKFFSWTGEHTLSILCFHLIDLDCALSERLNILGNSLLLIILRILLPLCGAFVLSKLSKLYKKQMAAA